MQRYGLIVADNGSDMYVSGAFDPRWDNGILNPAFRSLTASDFDVVELGYQPGAPAASNPAIALDGPSSHRGRLGDGGGWGMGGRAGSGTGEEGGGRGGLGGESVEAPRSLSASRPTAPRGQTPAPRSDLAVRERRIPDERSGQSVGTCPVRRIRPQHTQPAHSAPPLSPTT